MKLATYIAQLLDEKGIKTVFGYQGSSVSHIIDSVCTQGKIRFVETRHEQAAAFAANGYALAGTGVGVAISCSGPGVTNLITGVADAWYDSLPCLFICGQVSTRELRIDPNMRQLGFQELDAVALVSSITKYAVTVRSADRIAYELEKAFYYMQNGRPGPVLVDIPHDVQSANINPEELEHFRAPKCPDGYGDVFDSAYAVMEEMSRSRKPVILLGGGCQKLTNRLEIGRYLESMGIPVVVSYRGKDTVRNDSSIYCGTVGVYGDRCANWAVKYCDYLLVLGSRLDGRQTGDGQLLLAENAKIVVVDIDPVELRNMPQRYNKVNCDVDDFLKAAMCCTHNPACGQWLNLIKRWQKRYPSEKEYRIKERVNPNLLLKTVSQIMPENTVYALDVGQNQLWGNVSICVKNGQKLLQSCGLGTMGFALPAAIGGYYATYKIPVCVSGDGGFQMNLQELQTIAYYQIPVKILILNNQSLGLIRIYQGKALQGRCFGSVEGFGSPNYRLLAAAYGIDYLKITDNEFGNELSWVLHKEGPCLIEVCVSQESTNYPEPTYRSTIDNQSIVLSDEEKKKIMEELNAISEQCIQ